MEKVKEEVFVLPTPMPKDILIKLPPLRKRGEEINKDKFAVDDAGDESPDSQGEAIENKFEILDIGKEVNFLRKGQKVSVYDTALDRMFRESAVKYPETEGESGFGVITEHAVKWINND